MALQPQQAQPAPATQAQLGPNPPAQTPVQAPVVQSEQPQTPRPPISQQEFLSLAGDLEKLQQLQELSIATQTQQRQQLTSATALLQQESESQMQRVEKAYGYLQRNASNPAVFNNVMGIFDDTYSDRAQSYVIQEATGKIELTGKRFQMLKNLSDMKIAIIDNAMKLAAQQLETKFKLRQDVRADVATNLSLRSDARATEEAGRARALHPWQLAAAKANASSAESNALISQGNVVKMKFEQMPVAQLVQMSQDPETADKFGGYIDREIDDRTKRMTAASQAAVNLEASEVALTGGKADLSKKLRLLAEEHTINYLKTLPQEGLLDVFQRARGGDTTIEMLGPDGKTTTVTLTREQISNALLEVGKKDAEVITQVLAPQQAAVEADLAAVDADNALNAATKLGLDIANSAHLFATGAHERMRAAATSDPTAAAMFNKISTQLNTQGVKRIEDQLKGFSPELQPHIKHFYENGKVTIEGASAFFGKAMATPSAVAFGPTQGAYELLQAAVVKKLNPQMMKITDAGETVIDFTALASVTSGGTASQRVAGFIASALDEKVPHPADPQRKIPVIQKQLYDDVVNQYMLGIFEKMARGGIDVSGIVHVDERGAGWTMNALTNGQFDRGKVFRMLAAKGIDMAAGGGGNAPDLPFNIFTNYYNNPQNMFEFEQNMQGISNIESLSVLKLVGGTDNYTSLVRQLSNLDVIKNSAFQQVTAAAGEAQQTVNNLAAGGGLPAAPNISAFEIAAKGPQNAINQQILQRQRAMQQEMANPQRRPQ